MRQPHSKLLPITLFIVYCVSYHMHISAMMSRSFGSKVGCAVQRVMHGCKVPRVPNIFNRYRSTYGHTIVSHPSFETGQPKPIFVHSMDTKQMSHDDPEYTPSGLHPAVAALKLGEILEQGDLALLDTFIKTNDPLDYAIVSKVVAVVTDDGIWSYKGYCSSELVRKFGINPVHHIVKSLFGISDPQTPALKLCSDARVLRRIVSMILAANSNVGNGYPFFHAAVQLCRPEHVRFLIGAGFKNINVTLECSYAHDAIRIYQTPLQRAKSLFYVLEHPALVTYVDRHTSKKVERTAWPSGMTEEQAQDCMRQLKQIIEDLKGAGAIDDDRDVNVYRGAETIIEVL